MDSRYHKDLLRAETEATFCWNGASGEKESWLYMLGFLDWTKEIELIKQEARMGMYKEPFYNPSFVDPRTSPGHDSRLKARLNDGFKLLQAGDDEDLSDCEELQGRLTLSHRSHA